MEAASPPAVRSRNRACTFAGLPGKAGNGGDPRHGEDHDERGAPEPSNPMHEFPSPSASSPSLRQRAESLAVVPRNRPPPTAYASSSSPSRPETATGRGDVSPLRQPPARRPQNAAVTTSSAPSDAVAETAEVPFVEKKSPPMQNAAEKTNDSRDHDDPTTITTSAAPSANTYNSSSTSHPDSSTLCRPQYDPDQPTPIHPDDVNAQYLFSETNKFRNSLDPYIRLGIFFFEFFTQWFFPLSLPIVLMLQGRTAARNKGFLPGAVSPVMFGLQTFSTLLGFVPQAIVLFSGRVWALGPTGFALAFVVFRLLVISGKYASFTKEDYSALLFDEVYPSHLKLLLVAWFTVPEAVLISELDEAERRSCGHMKNLVKWKQLRQQWRSMTMMPMSPLAAASAAAETNNRLPASALPGDDAGSPVDRINGNAASHPPTDGRESTTGEAAAAAPAGAVLGSLSSFTLRLEGGAIITVREYLRVLLLRAWCVPPSVVLDKLLTVLGFLHGGHIIYVYGATFGWNAESWRDGLNMVIVVMTILQVAFFVPTVYRFLWIGALHYSRQLLSMRALYDAVKRQGIISVEVPVGADDAEQHCPPEPVNRSDPSATTSALATSMSNSNMISEAPPRRVGRRRADTVYLIEAARKIDQVSAIDDETRGVGDPALISWREPGNLESWIVAHRTLSVFGYTFAKRISFNCLAVAAVLGSLSFVFLFQALLRIQDVPLVVVLASTFVVATAFAIYTLLEAARVNNLTRRTIDLVASEELSLFSVPESQRTEQDELCLGELSALREVLDRRLVVDPVRVMYLPAEPELITAFLAFVVSSGILIIQLLLTGT